MSFEASWHQEYNDTAFIFIGNLPKRLNEEDVLSIFSQYGIPTEIKLVRDKDTGDSRGIAFLKYEDRLSAVLAIDNFNGIRLQDNSLKVDHCYYKPHYDDNGNEILNKYDLKIRKELEKDFHEASEV